QRAEMIPQFLSSTTNTKSAQQQTGKQHHDGSNPQKSKFLGQHREHKIRMRLRQIMQFLNTTAQPYSKPFPKTKSDQGMTELITFIKRIIPWIHEGSDSDHTIRLYPYRQRKQYHAHTSQHQK